MTKVVLVCVTGSLCVLALFGRLVGASCGSFPERRSSTEDVPLNLPTREHFEWLADFLLGDDCEAGDRQATHLPIRPTAPNSCRVNFLPACLEQAATDPAVVILTGKEKIKQAVEEGKVVVYLQKETSLDRQTIKALELGDFPHAEFTMWTYSSGLTVPNVFCRDIRQLSKMAYCLCISLVLAPWDKLGLIINALYSYVDALPEPWRVESLWLSDLEVGLDRLVSSFLMHFFLCNERVPFLNPKVWEHCIIRMMLRNLVAGIYSRMYDFQNHLGENFLATLRNCHANFGTTSDSYFESYIELFNGKCQRQAIIHHQLFHVLLLDTLGDFPKDWEENRFCVGQVKIWRLIGDGAVASRLYNYRDIFISFAEFSVKFLQNVNRIYQSGDLGVHLQFYSYYSARLRSFTQILSSINFVDMIQDEADKGTLMDMVNLTVIRLHLVNELYSYRQEKSSPEAEDGGRCAELCAEIRLCLDSLFRLLRWNPEDSYFDFEAELEKWLEDLNASELPSEDTVSSMIVAFEEAIQNMKNDQVVIPNDGFYQASGTSFRRFYSALQESGGSGWMLELLDDYKSKFVKFLEFNKQ